MYRTWYTKPGRDAAITVLPGDFAIEPEPDGSIAILDEVAPLYSIL